MTFATAVAPGSRRAAFVADMDFPRPEVIQNVWTRIRLDELSVSVEAVEKAIIEIHGIAYHLRPD